MKTLVRNFLSVLRRFKMAALLNVMGLSVAFAAFIVILMQLEYDYGFDMSDRNVESIFRIDQNDSERGQMAIICRPLADAFIQSSPHIVAGTLIGGSGNSLFFSVETEGKRDSYEEICTFVYPEITKVFDFIMVEGSANALEDPEKVLMPQGMARKLFGNQSAVGKLLIAGKQTYTVGGVFKDFPANSSVQNSLYLSMGDENLHSWDNWNYSFFIRVDKPENAAGLIDNFKKNFDAKGTSVSSREEGEGVALCMLPLKDLHFCGQVLFDDTPKTSWQTLGLLFAIAVVIVVIAGINFTNFSTALTPMRIKSINTQKILGSSVGAIRLALVFEAVAVALLSFLLSLFIVYLLGLTFVAGLVDADMSLLAHWPLIGMTAGLALLTGLLAGLYPAWYMTSFQPALVLKGSFGLSRNGRRLRNTLICIQYIASFSLIIGSLFMYLQNDYMQHSSLGYDRDQLIVAYLSNNAKKNYKALDSQLKSYSGIKEVTFANNMLSSKDQYMNWGRHFKDEFISYQVLPVEVGFLRVMGIPVTEGRNFRNEDMLTENGAYIFNETARKKFGLTLDDHINGSPVVGFMPDVKFASFRMEVTPMAFYVVGKNMWGNPAKQWHYYSYLYVQVEAGTDLREAMRHVRSTLSSFDPEYPFAVRFFDEVLDHLYKKEGNLSRMITMFSLIAIFISMVGVFGLVVFDSEYRRKEIGVRKVLGSTTGEILVMFNKGYIRILLICFVLAAPMAWYGVSRWLENFAYKTPMYLWVYLVAFLLVAFITVCTVTFQNWRAANSNPVDSIKSE